MLFGVPVLIAQPRLAPFRIVRAIPKDRIFGSKASFSPAIADIPRVEA